MSLVGIYSWIGATQFSPKSLSVKVEEVHQFHNFLCTSDSHAVRKKVLKNVFLYVLGYYYLAKSVTAKELAGRIDT